MEHIRLFFAGDFCSKPSTSLIKVSDDLKELIQSCDCKIINFEVPLKPNIELPIVHYERFFQSDDAPEFLKSLGFNLFSISNNHMFDWEEEGFYKTVNALDGNVFGAGTYEEAYSVKTVNIKGKSIGFMGLCYSCGKKVFDIPLHKEGLACSYINDLKVNHVIMEAKKKVDYLFILPHDGLEYIDIPMPGIIERYRDFIDYGADGVIGQHPHCPQGWETYKNKPIIYSLGNFFFNSKSNPDYRADKPHWYDGLCAVLDIVETKIIINIYCVKNSNNTFLSLDNSEERIKHNNLICAYLKDNSLYKKYYEEFVNGIVCKQYIKLINGAFYDLGFKYSIIALIRIFLRWLKNDVSYNKRIVEYLGNQLYSSALLTYFNKKNK